jgi:hypothetical protein
MSANVPAIPVAVRVYPVSSERRRKRRARTLVLRPDATLVWDTETRIDVTQRLTFGSYRFIEDGECLREALFTADDLTGAECNTLSRYIARHAADVSINGVARLDVLSRSEFLKKFFQLAYKGRLLVVAFNLPFDLSRLGLGSKLSDHVGRGRSS